MDEFEEFENVEYPRLFPIAVKAVLLSLLFIATVGISIGGAYYSVTPEAVKRNPVVSYVSELLPFLFEEPTAEQTPTQIKTQIVPSAAESVTKTETEAVTEAKAEAVTERITEAVTEAVTEPITEAETVPDEVVEDGAVAEQTPISVTRDYPTEFLALLTEGERTEAESMRDEYGFIFYNQLWSVTKNLTYGSEEFTFGDCGCGAACAAMIVSNLTDKTYTTLQARDDAIRTESITSYGGTTFAFIISTAESYGLKATNVGSLDTVKKALGEGKLVLFTVGVGDFTLGSHFMLMRGMTEDGQVLVVDSYSYKNTAMPWDFDRIIGQVKSGYWIFEAPTEN